MIAELVCYDCHSETTLFGYVTREDLKYTELTHLLDNEIKTQEDFEFWIDTKKSSGEAVYDGDILKINGVEVLDEFQRWEKNGSRCPECGSKNCEWF